MITAQAAAKEASPASRSPLRWVVALVLCIAIIAAFFDRISIAVLFENKGFQAAIGTGGNRALLGLLMTVFVFAYGFSSVLLSFVGDLFGARRSLVISTLSWGALMGLMGATSSYAALLVYRALLGLAEGPQFALVNAIVRNWFGERERGGANSLWVIGSPLGSAIGFPLAIFIVTEFGWRASFYVLGAINIVIVLPLILGLVRDRPPGAAAVKPPPASRTSYLADLAVIFRDWRYWMLTIYNCALLFYLWGFNAWLPSYLQAARHFNPRELGIFSALPFLFTVAGELGAGFLSDRLGRRAIFCFIGLGGGGILMYAVSLIAEPHLAAIVMALSAGLWGVGVPGLFVMAIEISPAAITATSVGAISGIGNLFGALAPLLMGLTITRFGSFDAGLSLLVVTSLVGACAMLPLLRRY